MLVFYFIPFLLFRPFIRIHAEEVECYMNQQRKRKLKLHLYIQPPDSFPGRYFLKFSLDRYHLLPLVLTAGSVLSAVIFWKRPRKMHVS